jgi:hypothetical protein
MSAAGSEGGTVAAPRAPFLIPTDVVAVALIAQTASENNVMLDALDLEPSFSEIPASFRLGVLLHLATFPLHLPL